MPMNRPIPTKHQHHIDNLARCWHANPPLDALLRLKWSQLLRRTPQPENGRRAHVAERVAESPMQGQPPSAVPRAKRGIAIAFTPQKDLPRFPQRHLILLPQPSQLLA
jgi:hypothetical protein